MSYEIGAWIMMAASWPTNLAALACVNKAQMSLFIRGDPGIG